MPNMTSDAPMIEARDIRKAFGANQVLRGVSLQLRQGEVVAVIGPSGSGKSTFLRCLNHLETIDAGRIAIEGDTLADNDAYHALQTVGGLIMTGPTGTNVNDVAVVLAE